MENKVHTAHIVIDSRTYESPEITTGAALYHLGQIKSDFDLFKEIKGRGDDELVHNNGDQVAIRNGDVFYSAKHTLNPGAQ